MTRKDLLILVLPWIIIGCANRGIGPQGGPKDSVPPAPLRSVPENGAVEFHGNRLEIAFNEYLQLDNIGQNLIMSPPQNRPPDVKVRGKRLMVQFADSLRDSTTYTLDFGNAVCDFTEKNPIRNYLFAFSTGPFIDTLEVRGKVYDARTLNPMEQIFVGIHSNHADSAFTRLPFDRIARTDTAGAFVISNIHSGSYRLYAVDEVSRDYRLTPGEALAFADSSLTPEVHPHYETDSLGHDTLLGYDYGPADLILWLFKENQQRLYLQSATREQQHLVRFSFSAPPDSLPSLRALPPYAVDSTRTDSIWTDPMPYIHTQFSEKNDSLTLWLTDSIAIAQDSIFLEVRYRRTDSLYQLEWATDTLRAIWRAPRLSAKAKAALERKNKARTLELKSNARNGFELYDTIEVSCASPIASVMMDSIHLFERVDTVLKPVALNIVRDLVGIGGMAAYNHEMEVVGQIVHRLDCHIQVLNAKDEVLRELPAVPEGAFFNYLKPDTYYLRLYLDKDGDGQWTTGSWKDHRQPEQVYYFPDKLQTKSNWDFEEEWNYMAVPQLEAKPKELIKAAAAAMKKK